MPREKQDRGYATGKTGSGHKFIDVIVLYGGTSIYALDQYLRNGGAIGSLDPSEALVGLSNLVQYLGFPGLETLRNQEAIVVFSSASEFVATNVYTCYRPLLHDFGYIGMLIARLLFGAFYTALIQAIKRNRTKYRFKKVVLIAMVFNPVLMQCIQETWIRDLPSVTTILSLILLNYLFANLTKTRRYFVKIGKIMI